MIELKHPTQEVINFYRTGDDYGWMSNFYKALIRLDDKEWASTEHYYQAQKTLDPEIREQIRLATRSAEAADLGRSCELRPDWDVVKIPTMRKAVEAKFDQHPILADKLVRTGFAWLVEKTSGTPRPDAVWGDGADGKGSNYLGMILMEVRANLRHEMIRTGKLDI